MLKTISGVENSERMSERKMKNVGQLLAFLWSSSALWISVLRFVTEFEEVD